MSDDALSAARLGVDDARLDVDDSATVARISLALASQCQRYLDIASRHLDPVLYDDDAFVEAVKQLALSHRYARIRLFIADSRPLVGRGHRLLQLAVRLPTFISVRGPAPQHRDFNEAMLLADRTGYVHRRFSDRFEAAANFNDRRTSAALGERFDELWDRGVPDPEFRRLHI